ncbi:MAG TPA: alpha-ketoglutarate-dependent dioxygenase AlkB [Luteibacter sp.]|jgi:alkylated DNA repair dioxygenase AlkB|nr:alpha-ketoglutarate-dependent dioxygenase AlkB [Luteibacter sp.]
MKDLFAAPWETLELPGADVTLCREWLGAAEADVLFGQLRDETDWEVHRIRVFGREVDSPRLSSWIGDADAVYTYSHTRFVPRPWTEALSGLRVRVEQACGTRFNSVLLNLYRDGTDSMGWHSDDEATLGIRPVIASVSLGERRRFRFRDRRDHKVSVVELDHGSLLRMAGDTQALYQHDLPKVRAATAARINLTFRYVQPS